MDAIPTNVYGPPQRNAADRTIICKPPIPRSRIPNLGMAYGKDRTSNVAPWGVGHRLSDGYPGERVRVGKEGRKRKT